MKKLKTLIRLSLPVALVAASTFLHWQTQALERKTAQPGEVIQAPRFHPRLALVPPPGERPITVAADEIPLAVDVAPGQTLGGLLAALGLEPAQVRGALTALRERVEVRRLRAGSTILAFRDGGGQLVRLMLDQRDGRVELARDGDRWDSRLHPYERRIEHRVVSGTVDGALETAVRAGGGAPRVAYGMASVLAWDLDFNRDLRRGDRFQVLYEEVYLDGTYEGPGQILALIYENRGKRYEAYRFDQGYYDGDGRPLRKMFLRSPLPFSRVTSRFNPRRFHPVLKVYRPHNGVDYGAPTGTPVRVTANGTVVSAGRSGQAGNMVKVRHPNGYLTAYLHLSRFAKGIGAGKRVEQGQVIGYVGSTGLSTAPHLDYRVQKNGRWIDPLTVQPTPAEPVPTYRMDDFLAYRDALRHSLRSGAPPPASPQVLVAQSARRPAGIAAR